jgi:NAD(P)-dependent dehydrogenase (short-subunit alcohol dehydrogenase family)
MSNTHAGKVAIITGSARGIGAAIASQLASESAKARCKATAGGRFHRECFLFYNCL